MCLFGTLIISRSCRHRGHSENWVEVTLWEGTFVCKWVSPFVRVFPFCARKRGMTNPQKVLPVEKARTLICITNLLLLATCHNWLLTPTSSVFSWHGISGGGFVHFRELLGFPRSVLYTQEVYMLLKSYLMFSIHLSQLFDLTLRPARRTLKGRGKFFLPNNTQGLSSKYQPKIILMPKKNILGWRICHSWPVQPICSALSW